MVPPILSVSKEGPLGHVEPQFSQSQKLLSRISKIVHVFYHWVPHLRIWPGARSVTWPFVEDSWFGQIKVFGHSEDLGVVRHPICL